METCVSVHVKLEERHGGGCVEALAALERSFVHRLVGLLVSLEIAFDRESFSALRALERLLLGVHSLVLQQLRLEPEVLWAIIALIILGHAGISRVVHVSHVRRQVAVCLERLGAKVALG